MGHQGLDHVRSAQSGREVLVSGYGLVKREQLDGVFVFDITYSTVLRIAPRVSYAVLRWSNEGEPSDQYMLRTSQTVVKQRLESEARASLSLDFLNPKLTNASPETRVAEGTGSYSGRGGILTGSFQYKVAFNRKNGAIERVEVTPLASNPGIGWGDRLIEGDLQTRIHNGASRVFLLPAKDMKEVNHMLILHLIA